MPDTSLSTGAMKLMIWPKGSDLAPIKAAVLALNLPYSVSPFWFDPTQYADERVLVLADGFEYSTIADRIYPKSASVLPDAILWCLGEKELERGPSYAEDVMSRILNGAVMTDIWHTPGDEPKEDEPW